MSEAGPLLPQSSTRGTQPPISSAHSHGRRPEIPATIADVSRIKDTVMAVSSQDGREST